MVKSDNQVKAIGGYFELADKDCEWGHMPVEGVALNTCRNALEYIILQLADVKRIYVPYYTCEAVIESLKRLPVEYEFYRINEQLEMAEEIVLHDGDYLIANNYFGVKDAYVAKLADKYSTRLIIDNAQALFAPILPGIRAVYSTRKFVGVADGGFAVGAPAESVLEYAMDNSSEHDSHLFIRKEKGAEAGFKDYQVNECKLDNQSIRRMSPQTQSILSHIDYETVILKRRQNYRYLNEVLGEINLLRLPPMDSFACPKVFGACYWPNVLEWCRENEMESKLAIKIIPLPIDQRYGEMEMNYIVEILRTII